MAARWGDLRLVMLSMLADGPKTGHEMRRALVEGSEGRYLPSGGSIYPRLTALEVHGLVSATAEN